MLIMSFIEQLPRFSLDEYLFLERTSETMHEYLEGIVYPLVGESPENCTICHNLSAIFETKLANTACRRFSFTMKVCTSTKDLVSYPDLMIVCGEPLYLDEDNEVLLNPIAVFEVLSPSTEKYDRGEKFTRYTENIPSLQDYVLVSQSEAKIELFTKQDTSEWTKNEVSGLENDLYIASIDCRIPLEEVYLNITFQEN